MKERIPDSVLQEADEVVNIDLTAEELIARLKAGKIYKPEKVSTALNNFFKTENILQLRELALKEVALRVERKWRMKWLPVWESVMRDFWHVSAATRKHHDASFVKLHVWQPATILRLLPFMCRLPEKVLTGIGHGKSKVFIEPLQIGDRTGRGGRSGAIAGCAGKHC